MKAVEPSIVQGTILQRAQKGEQTEYVFESCEGARFRAILPQSQPSRDPMHPGSKACALVRGREVLLLLAAAI